MEDDLYAGWLADYGERRQALRIELMSIGEKAIEAESSSTLLENQGMLVGAQVARAHRADITNKFCFLLWGREFDEAFFAEIVEDEDVSHDEASAILDRKSTNFLPRIARVTARLDLAGFYAAMLQPQGMDTPPEPLVFDADPDMWFEIFRVLIELAEAIIVEANYSRGLFRELQHIDNAGLSNRVLCFDTNDELYRMDSDDRWPLAEIGDAVAFASAQALLNPT